MFSETELLELNLSLFTYIVEKNEAELEWEWLLNDWNNYVEVPPPTTSFPEKLSLKRKQSETSYTSRESYFTPCCLWPQQQKRPKHTEFNILPIYSASYYAEKVIQLMNTFDFTLLLTGLQSCCTSDVKILKSIYSLDPIQPYLKTTSFPSLSNFCQYLEAWNVFLPDGMFTTSHHRMIVNRSPTLVFMSCIHFTGTKVVPEVNVLLTPLEQYPPNYHDTMAGALFLYGPTPSITARYLQPYRLNGSLATYVNRDGYITRLELYLTDVMT